MLAEGLSDEALAGAGGSSDQDRLMGGDPTVLGKLEQLLFAQPPGSAVVEALDRGGALLELRDLSVAR